MSRRDTLRKSKDIADSIHGELEKNGKLKDDDDDDLFEDDDDDDDYAIEATAEELDAEEEVAAVLTKEEEEEEATAKDIASNDDDDDEEEDDDDDDDDEEDDDDDDDEEEDDDDDDENEKEDENKKKDEKVKKIKDESRSAKANCEKSQVDVEGGPTPDSKDESVHANNSNNVKKRKFIRAPPVDASASEAKFTPNGIAIPVLALRRFMELQIYAEKIKHNLPIRVQRIIDDYDEEDDNHNHEGENENVDEDEDEEGRVRKGGKVEIIDIPVDEDDLKRELKEIKEELTAFFKTDPSYVHRFGKFGLGGYIRLANRPKTVKPDKAYTQEVIVRVLQGALAGDGDGGGQEQPIVLKMADIPNLASAIASRIWDKDQQRVEKFYCFTYTKGGRVDPQHVELPAMHISAKEAYAMDNASFEPSKEHILAKNILGALAKHQRK